MSEFCYVYVLLSRRDSNFYTGSTHDLKRRVSEHQAGEAPSTTARRPLELVYYEACPSRADAMRRERYLKSTWGKRYLRGRLKNYLKGSIAAPTTAAVRCTRSEWRSRRILLADAQFAQHPAQADFSL